MGTIFGANTYNNTLIRCHCKTSSSHRKFISIPCWVMSTPIRLAQKRIFELSIEWDWGNDSLGREGIRRNIVYLSAKSSLEKRIYIYIYSVVTGELSFLSPK